MEPWGKIVKESKHGIKIDGDWIERLKIEIISEYQSKMDALVDEMNSALADLLADKDEFIPFTPISVVTLCRQSKKIEDRIKAAIEAYPGSFSSSDILRLINGDVREKTLKLTTFAPVFSKMLKNEDLNIVTVKRPGGRSEGVYRLASRNY